jgi:hypothetical protein
VKPDQQLAAFCQTLPRLRDAVRKQGLAHLLDDVVENVRAGKPLSEQLPRLGIPADTLRGPGPTDLTVPSVAGKPFDEVYVCPVDHCDRAVPREPGGPLPAERCWLRDEPFRRRRA